MHSSPFIRCRRHGCATASSHRSYPPTCVGWSTDYAVNTVHMYEYGVTHFAHWTRLHLVDPPCSAIWRSATGWGSR